MCATRTRAICGARRRCRSATTATYVARHGFGLQPLRARGTRHCARPAAIRAARRSGQDLPPDAAQPSARPRGCRSRLMPNGCSGTSRGASAPFIVDRDRSGHRRDARPQSLEHGLWIARRIRRSGRAPDGLDGRPAGIHRPQRGTRRPAALVQRGARCPDGGAGSRPLRRAAATHRTRRRTRRIEIVLLPRRIARFARTRRG